MRTQQLSRRQLLQRMAGLAATAALAACAPKAEPTPESKPTTAAATAPAAKATTAATAVPAPAKKTEIVYYDRTTSAPAWADLYNKVQDKVTVKVEIQPPNTRYEQLVAAISAGNSPDVIGVDITSVGRFAEMKAIVPLDDLIPKNILDSYFQNLIKKNGHYGFYKNKLYGVPFWVDNSILFYNKTFLKEAGGDPEKGIRTWDDYRNYGKAITKDGRIGFSMSAASARFLYKPWIWAQGGNWVNADFTAGTMDSPACVSTLQFVRELVTVLKITNDAAGTDWNAMTNLFTGQKAMIVHQGGGLVGLVRSQFPELWNVLGVCPIPGPKEGQKSSFIGGNVASVATATKAKEASLDFTIWATASDEGMGVTGTLGYLPGCPKGLNLPVYQKDKAVYDPFKEALEFGYPSENDSRMNELRAPIQDAFTWAAQTDKSIEQIVNDANKALNTIFKGS